MNEPRHWILILPPILLLSLTCLRRIAEIPGRAVRWPALALVVAAVLALFPWSRYRQQPAGYERLATAVSQPARMMVSTAEGWREGSWVVIASLRESRPSSVIVRATKALARSGWNGDYYKLLTTTPAAIEDKLDRLGIETIILDNRFSGAAPLAHHRMLREILASNSAWRESAVSGDLSAWRRVRPPAAPREPLTLDLRWSGGRVISER
jgi:hypothetical protein